MPEQPATKLNSVTPDQRRRMDELIEKYKRCFIVHGPFHAKHNERRIERFVEESQPESWEFIRINVELTYVFWNPQPKHDPHKKVHT